MKIILTVRDDLVDDVKQAREFVRLVEDLGMMTYMDEHNDLESFQVASVEVP